ncbi:adenosine receptor A1-like isoform X2 [Hyla sarda]|uniref:adenosine receptor A1-like isoform X2 n=1 Tax=Hyla sarda TaxID=327740 RepID=UPI0024C3BF5A|nr:adenosine receptor A1-like isoform X2 [Hyla sarda]XP_056396628.1 adenosine receptor A1-like isoform X2 [Hyla sarda]
MVGFLIQLILNPPTPQDDSPFSILSTMNFSPAVSGSASSAPLVTKTNIPYLLTEVLTAVISVVGNTLICLAIINDRRLRTVTNNFLLSLATADILVGAVAIPCAIMLDLGVSNCSLYSCLLMLCNLMTFSLASIFGLLAVAVERYISILRPFHYRALVTPRSSVIVIICTWMLAALAGLMPLMGWRQPFPPERECLFSSLISESYMVYLIFFGCVVSPLITMLVLYARIFLEIRRQIRQIAEWAVDMSRRRRRRRVLVREFRMATSLFLVVFCFVVCWFPIHILNVIRLFCPQCVVPTDLVLSAVILSHANSAINPIIYVFRMRTFRRAIEATLSCSCGFGAVGSVTASSMGKAAHEQRGEGNLRDIPLPGT